VSVEVFVDERFGHAQLPPLEAVEHPAIKAALSGYLQAKAAAAQSRQDAVELEQVERPRAEQADREVLAQALAEGKAPPKGRSAAERAGAAIEEAERVASARQLLADQAFDRLKAAFAEFGSEWAEITAAGWTRPRRTRGAPSMICAPRLAGSSRRVPCTGLRAAMVAGGLVAPPRSGSVAGMTSASTPRWPR
jgi:hypothetical protein